MPNPMQEKAKETPPVTCRPMKAEAASQEILSYVRPEQLLERLGRNHHAPVATLDDKIVGVIEIRDASHIALLFVEEACQGKGGTRALLQAALQCPVSGAPRTITVNATPNSLAAYYSLGFRPMASEQVKNGVRFVPMVLKLPSQA